MVGLSRELRTRRRTREVVTGEKCTNRLYPIVVPSVIFFHSAPSRYSSTHFSTRCPSRIFSCSNSTSNVFVPVSEKSSEPVVSFPLVVQLVKRLPSSTNLAFRPFGLTMAAPEARLIPKVASRSFFHP